MPAGMGYVIVPRRVFTFVHTANEPSTTWILLEIHLGPSKHTHTHPHRHKKQCHESMQLENMCVCWTEIQKKTYFNLASLYTNIEIYKHRKYILYMSIKTSLNAIVLLLIPKSPWNHLILKPLQVARSNWLIHIFAIRQGRRKYHNHWKAYGNQGLMGWSWLIRSPELVACESSWLLENEWLGRLDGPAFQERNCNRCNRDWDSSCSKIVRS